MFGYWLCMRTRVSTMIRLNLFSGRRRGEIQIDPRELVVVSGV